LHDRVPRPQPTAWADKKDAAALVVVLLFALPVIAVTGMLQRDVQGVARFGSLQSPDGANHFMILSEMSQKQHLDYSGASYYPMGFHLSFAFVQDSVHLNQAEHRFGVNARVFIMQYLVFGSVLAFLFAYFCRMVIDMLGPRLKARTDYVLALAAGVPFAVLFLLPFMYQGFLNYYYVAAVILAGLIYLHAAYGKEQEKRPDVRRLFLLGYLMLTFGAGMSWPLLVPPLLLVPLLYLLPINTELRHLPQLVRQAVRREHWLVIAAFLLQLAPIYMQLRYAVLGTGEQFNAYGSIRTFHFGVIILGLTVVLYASLSQRLPAEAKRFIGVVFQPFYLFLAALMVAQYFLAGELRYYAIKSSLLIEVILLAVVAAGVVYSYAQRATGWVERACMPVLVVMVGALLLVGLNANPLKDVREMFRQYSGFGTPVFFDSDVKRLTGIGSSGDVHDSNITVVHYDTQTNKLHGNLMPANWIEVMQPQAAVDSTAQVCSAQLYTIAMYQEFGPTQQTDFKNKVRECIRLAKAAGRNYYIITDNASVPYLKDFFGGYAKIVD
jgi:hypothetical protein